MIGQTVLTKEDMKQGLRRLGLGERNIVGVHSSLSSSTVMPDLELTVKQGG